MILVDSSVWIDYFNGAVTPQSDKLDELLGQKLLLIISDRILTEALQGFGNNLDFDRTHCSRHLYSDRDFEPFVKHLGLRSA